MDAVFTASADQEAQASEVIEWRSAEAEDVDSLSRFVCYPAPKNWAPNTPYSVRKNHMRWLQDVQKMVRQLRPPYLGEDALVCSLAEDGEIDGILYMGEPESKGEVDELYIYLYVIARSLRSVGCSVGPSAMARIENLADEAASRFPDTNRVYVVGIIHEYNQPSRYLLESHGWKKRGLTSDPKYAQWVWALNYED